MLSERFAELVAEHGVVGAQVAVLADGEITDAAAGLLSLRTGVEATTDSVFQLGSITKLWTSTLIMQLVDDGKLDLDAPVRAYLPELRLADEDTSAAVTTRHLLTHTAGFEGDIFDPTTKGDDAVERFVADLLPGAAQNSPLGTLFSYNNAGFVLLGRIVEVLRGQPWASALREHLVQPLGLEHVATGADEAILFRAATGHVRARSEEPLEPAKVWALSHSMAPAGAMLAMSARDLLGFARMCLSEPTAAAMFEPQVELPERGMADRWGLGWMLFDWDGGRLVGHDGGTIGQASVLRILPSAGVAVAVLANGGDVGPLFNSVLSEVLAKAGVTVPDPVTPPKQPVPITDADRYVGRYEARGTRFDVEAGTGDFAGDLWVTMTPTGALAESLGVEPERQRFVGASGDTIVAAEPVAGSYPTFAFVGSDDSGHAGYLHSGRAVPYIPG